MVFTIVLVIVTIIVTVILTRHMWSLDKIFIRVTIPMLAVLVGLIAGGIISSCINAVPVEEKTYNLEMIDGDTYVMVNPEDNEYVIKIEDEESLILFKTLDEKPQIYFNDETHIFRETVYETPEPWNWIFFNFGHTEQEIIIPEGMINYQHPYYNN